MNFSFSALTNYMELAKSKRNKQAKTTSSEVSVSGNDPLVGQMLVRKLLGY